MDTLLVFMLYYLCSCTEGITYRKLAPQPDLSRLDTILYMKEEYEQADNPKIQFVSELIQTRLNLTFILPQDCRQEVLQYLDDNEVEYDIPITDLQRMLEMSAAENMAARDSWRHLAGRTPLDLPQYYMDYSEIVSWMNAIAHDYSDVATLRKLGQTHERRDILAIQIPNDASGAAEVVNVFINAGLDPRNWLAPASTLHLLHKILLDKNLRDGVSWFIVPLANPDGYVYNMNNDRLWMKNRQPYGACYGTDLIKNWPHYHGLQAARTEPCHRLHRGPEPFSEPETRALRDAILADPALDAYISIQGTPGAWMQPWAGKSFLKTEDYEDLIDVSVAVTNAINTDDDVIMRNGTPPDLRRHASGAAMDWVKEHTPVKYAYTMALGHAGDQSTITFIQPPSQIDRNGQWLVTAMKAMTSSIRHFRETGEWEHVTLGGKPKGYTPPLVRFYNLKKEEVQPDEERNEL